MAKIYNFEEIKQARQREDYLQFRHETIQTTIADIEELVVEVSTEIAYKYMQAHLNMSDEELRKSVNRFLDKVQPTVIKVEDKFEENRDVLLRLKNV